MSEDVTNAVSQLKGLLNKYPDKKLEILQYVFGKDTIMKIINRPTYDELQQENNQLKAVIEEVREYINNYDVFKEFSFPLMKRDEENQTKSSIKYEFDTSIKKELLQILDKVDKNRVY